MNTSKKVKFYQNNILLISIINMLTYLSHEMIYPLIPLYLTLTLGVTPAIVGLIEGISKGLSSLLRFYSGYVSDKNQKKKKIITFAYILTSINKILLALSCTWLWILVAKIVDRFGKAIRVSPMDAIVSESLEEKKRGKAFGIDRFFHKLGASIGIFISYILIINSSDIDYNKIFFISLIPILIVFLLITLIKEERIRGIRINLKNIDRKLKILLVIVFFSSIGNITKSFLLLRAEDIDFSVSQVILLYLLSNVICCIFSYIVGKVCDIFKKKYIVALSYLLYAITCLCFAITDSKGVTIILFMFYGIYISLISVGIKSYIAELAPPNMKATLLGFNDCLIGIGSLPSATIVGLLWNILGSTYSFLYCFIIGILSSLLILTLTKNKSLAK